MRSLSVSSGEERALYRWEVLPLKWTCCVRRALQRRGSPGDTQMWLTNKRAFHTASGEDDYICVIYIWHSRCWLKANSILRYLPVSEKLELLSGWHLAQPFNAFEGGKHLCCFRSIFVVLSKHKNQNKFSHVQPDFNFFEWLYLVRSYLLQLGAFSGFKQEWTCMDSGVLLPL